MVADKYLVSNFLARIEELEQEIQSLRMSRLQLLEENTALDDELARLRKILDEL